MVLRTVEFLPDLYESDETAWLQAMADLIRSGQHEELDHRHLAEYLSDMAKRDKREVESRLAILIAHLLKWTFQKEKRSHSWRTRFVVPRQALVRLLRSGTLRKHAESALANAYSEAVEQAAAATGLPQEDFPQECLFTLEALLSDALLPAD